MRAQDGPKLERCLNVASGGLINLLKQHSGSWGLEAMCLLVHFRNRTQHLGVVSIAVWASFGGDNWIFQVEGPSWPALECLLPHGENVEIPSATWAAEQWQFVHTNTIQNVVECFIWPQGALCLLQMCQSSCEM